MLSALAIGSLAAVGSLLLLLYQRIAHYVVVPTNVLMAIVFVGLGAVIMLVLVTVAAYLAIGVAISQSNAVCWGIVSGLLGYAIANGALTATDIEGAMSKVTEKMATDDGTTKA